MERDGNGREIEGMIRREGKREDEEGIEVDKR